MGGDKRERWRGSGSAARTSPPPSVLFPRLATAMTGRGRRTASSKQTDEKCRLLARTDRTKITVRFLRFFLQDIERLKCSEFWRTSQRSVNLFSLYLMILFCFFAGRMIRVQSQSCCRRRDEVSRPRTRGPTGWWC